MHRHGEAGCSRCGYTTKEEAALEAELAAIRNEVKRKGLALTQTAYAPHVACRRMGVTRSELNLLLTCRIVLDSTVGGRLRITRAEVERWNRAKKQ